MKLKTRIDRIRRKAENQEMRLDFERSKTWADFMATFTDGDLDRLEDGTAPSDLQVRWLKAREIRDLLEGAGLS
jgi:hypothetical protein